MTAIQFFHTTEFFGVHNETNAIHLLEEKGIAHCARDWHESRVEYHWELESNLSKYCFSSAYIPKLIKEGLGITLDSVHIKTVREVKGVKIDWALGAAVI